MDDDLKRLIEGTAAETRRIADGMQRIGEQTQRNTAEIERLADEVRRTAAETRRHFDIVAEGMRGDVAIGLEGVATNGQRIDRLIVDMKEEFAETRSMIRFSHSELDRRLRTLEEVVSGLQSRVERLESASTH